MARNTIASYFFTLFFIFFAVYVVGYLLFQKFKRTNVKSKCLDQMCICAVWSRYIDGISLDQVCNGVG